MSISIMFAKEDGSFPWTAEDVRKLETALDVLQRRFDLGIDRPAERHDQWFAIGALHQALAGAAGNDIGRETPAADHTCRIDARCAAAQTPAISLHGS